MKTLGGTADNIFWTDRRTARQQARWTEGHLKGNLVCFTEEVSIKSDRSNLHHVKQALLTKPVFFFEEVVFWICASNVAAYDLLTGGRFLDVLSISLLLWGFVCIT